MTTVMGSIQRFGQISEEADRSQSTAFLDPVKRSLAEFALKAAEAHFTVAEYAALAQELASGKADVRVYDDGIVITRQYEAKAATR
jgi:hypothetical protein